MNKSNIENSLPEQEQNSEQKADETMSSPDIANAPVVRIPFFALSM